MPAAANDRHRQGVTGQLGLHVIRHRPADDLSRVLFREERRRVRGQSPIPLTFFLKSPAPSKPSILPAQLLNLGHQRAIPAGRASWLTRQLRHPKYRTLFGSTPKLLAASGIEQPCSLTNLTAESLNSRVYFRRAMENAPSDRHYPVSVAHPPFVGKSNFGNILRNCSVVVPTIVCYTENPVAAAGSCESVAVALDLFGFRIRSEIAVIAT